MSQFYNDENSTDTMLREITENLSKQVIEGLEGTEEEIESIKTNDEEGKKGRGIKKVFITVGSVLFVLILGVVLAGQYFLGQINYVKDSELEIIEDPDVDKSEVVVAAKEIIPVDNSVINILLIGEEKMKDTTRGRSDSMMIATINQKQKSLKLTSIMRDCYVVIPEHGQGKLNSAYNIGGSALLLSTIEQNFEIPLDGYVLVNFDDFEAIIDKLGGVDIELSEAEASYLRRKDYITDPSQRTVVAGMNHMSGNQALGFSRVRYVKSNSGESDDFGRTNRQRVVLNAIFTKYKSKNLVELVTITTDLLQNVTTNLTKTEILGYVAAVVGTGMSELETFRIPMNNGYSTAKLKAGEVLVVNFEKNNAALNEFIFGAGDEKKTENTEDTDDTMP